MADLPITSDEGATPVVITGAASPFSTLIINADGSLNNRSVNISQVTAGTIAGVGQQTSSPISGGSVLIEVTGTWVGTLAVLGQIDSSSTGLFISNANGASPLAYTYTSFSANGIYKVLVPSGYISISVQALSWTSGSASVTINCSTSANVVEAVQLNQANFLTTAYQGGLWNITATNPSITYIGNPVPSEATYVAGSVTTGAPSYTSGQIEPLSLTTSGGLRIDGSAVTQPVSGSVSVSNFPATQPVSGTIAATQSGAWSITAVQSTGTNLHTVVDSGTISTITNPVTVAQPTAANLNATVTGTVATTQSGTWTVQPGNIPNTTPWLADPNAAILSQTGTAATGVALTVTLPAVAASYHYITLLEIEAYSTAARTGGATPVLVTSTNFPVSNVWTFATAAAIGTTDSKTYPFERPCRSSVVNTATTIVCPATTGIIWRVNVYYYTGA